MKYKTLLAFALATCTNATQAQSLENRIQHTIDSFYQAIPNASGIMVHIESPDKNISWSYAVGYADKKTRQKVSANQPALLASNTKTYVAATILKLVEMKKFSINDPIEDLISARSKGLFKNDGYDPASN